MSQAQSMCYALTEPQLLLSSHIHIHQINLDTFPSQWDYLTTEEKNRANKMPIEKFRTRFINGRGYLRYCLNYYLQQSHQDLNFIVGEKGKLYLPNSNLFFNIAHSNEQALFAFNYDDEIGIDIEQPRQLHDMQAIAKRVFSELELAALAQVEQAYQQQYFFTLWTRKEAVIKATGAGLTASLQDITTTHYHDEIANPIPHIESLGLQLIDLSIAEPSKAALAARLNEKELLFFC